jgi:hypothetical protein
MTKAATLMNTSGWTVEEVRYDRQATDSSTGQFRAAYLYVARLASTASPISVEVEVTDGQLDSLGGPNLTAPSDCATDLVRAFVTGRLAKGWKPTAGDVLHITDADIALLRKK